MSSVETSIFLRKKSAQDILPRVEDFLFESTFSFHLAAYFLTCVSTWPLHSQALSVWEGSTIPV